MSRDKKVVQIALVPAVDESHGPYLYLLDNDGFVWRSSRPFMNHQDWEVVELPWDDQ